MPGTYTGNPANNPTSITIPSDGDGPGIKAADVNPAFEGLMDKVANTQASVTTEATARAAADSSEASARAAADLVLTDLLLAAPPGLRLTIVSGDPVPTGDHAGSTLYYTPYASDAIALYDGTQWRVYKTPEISLGLTGTTANKVYDVFAYWTGSAVALELSAAWASNTTRTDALARQDGIYVKSADHTRRFVGTFLASAINTIYDDGGYRGGSAHGYRGLWNMYNRVRRPLAQWEVGVTTSWTYTSTAWRAAHGNTANAIGFVCGEPMEVHATVQGYASGSSNVNAAVGIGLDSSTANSADSYGGSAISSAVLGLRAEFSEVVAAGAHSLTWLESGDVTTTFYGYSAGSILSQAAISARLTM